MTANDVEAARACITDTLAKAEAATKGAWKATRPRSLSEWAYVYTQPAIELARATPDDAAFIAAVSPDRMIRVCREALAVLDRHRAAPSGICRDHGSDWHVWPCHEVEAVVRAWAP